MDIIVRKVVALGVPGLALMFFVSASGLAGGAAIVTALATLGGPLGMMGGFAVLGVLTLISDGLARYGLDALAKSVVAGLKEKGATVHEIRKQVEALPISHAMRTRILEYVH